MVTITNTLPSLLFFCFSLLDFWICYFYSRTVSLTYLDDMENAREAYEQAVVLEPRCPSVALNYAIFLSNHEVVVK